MLYMDNSQGMVQSANRRCKTEGDSVILHGEALRLATGAPWKASNENREFILAKDGEFQVTSMLQQRWQRMKKNEKGAPTDTTYNEWLDGDGEWFKVALESCH